MVFSHENKITLQFHKKNPKPSKQWSIWQNLNPNQQNKIININLYPSSAVFLGLDYEAPSVPFIPGWEENGEQCLVHKNYCKW